MAKELNTILGKDKKLEGVKSSTVKSLDMGDYNPTAKGEKTFVQQHSVEKHEDRVGNTDDVYKSKNKPAKYPVRTEQTNKKFSKMDNILEQLSLSTKPIKFTDGNIVLVDETISKNLREVFSLLDEENKEKFINVVFSSFDDYVSISKLKDE